LNIIAIEYKALANNGDYDLVGFQVAVSPLILGAAIWNSKEELVFHAKTIGNLLAKI
jgi:hypothetical protein